MDFDHRGQCAPTTRDAANDALIPGKRTQAEFLLVQRREADAETAHAASTPAPLPVSASSGPRPTLQELFGVQRFANAAPVDDPARVHAAAARGTATPASTLPHADRIQRLFGRHDISGIQAHLGSDATASAREMGAQAYATSDHVVLGEGAGLHTVAHEAAHVIQQRGGVQLQGGVGAAGDPYERHADAVADCVVAGESAESTLDQMTGQGSSPHAIQHSRGHAVQRDQGSGAGAPAPGAPSAGPGAAATAGSGFSVSTFAEKIADAAKKALFAEIKARTGFDADAGTFDGDLDINEAIRLVQVLGKLDNILVTGSNNVHLHIDFVGLSFVITAGVLHLAGIVNDATGFSCGSIDLSQVSISGAVAAPGTTVAIVANLHVGAAVIRGASFVEYQLGEPSPIKRLTADEVDLASINANGIDLVLSGNRWFARMKLGAGAIKGMHYPGLPPTNVAIVKAAFTLDSIHGAIGSGGDGPAIPEAPDVGLPKDSHIDVVVDRGEAAMMEPGSGMSLKLFTATVTSADNRQLAKVEIKGFHAGKANDTNDAGASIDFVHFSGDPKFTQALLGSEPVRSKADAALKVLESAGIKPSMGVDVTLTNIGVGSKGGTTTAKASLDANLDLGDIGQLRVALVNFDTIIETAEVDAAFDTFTATLTKNGPAIASVELDGAGGRVKMGADGAPTGGSASTKFKVTGNLPKLIETFNQALPKLPRSVQRIVPIIKALKVDATVSGSVSGGNEDSELKVNGDLDVAITAAGNTTATISLHGFRTNKDGAITRASFDSFSATLKTADGKDAASVTATGVHGWVADGDGKSMTIPSLVFKGNGANISILAAAISKKAASLPPGIKDVCNLVAANAVAASGTVTINDGKAKLDAAGNEEVDAKTLVANIWVNGVGSISVVVAGFVQTADAPASGKKQVAFDRIDAKLKTATKAEAATFWTTGDKVVGAGGATTFTAKQIHADGDAAAIQQLLAGVQNNIKNLPGDVQSAIALVDELKVNGSGKIDLTNVDASNGSKGVKAKSDANFEFKVPGVGQVVVKITGLVADVQKASTEVAFDTFNAVLSDPSKQELATFGVVVSAPADPTAGTAAADPNHAHVESTGEQQNRDKLLDALHQHLTALPPQVDTVIHLLQAGSQATVKLNSVDLKSQGGKLVTRGNASLSVDVPNVGHVDLKIIGRDKADGADVDDKGGFKRLTLDVHAAAAPPPADGQSAPAPADPIASMEVLGGTLNQDNEFHADSFSVKGNGSLIASLLSKESRSLFPAEVAQWLGLFDEKQLKQGSGNNLQTKKTTNGSLVTSVHNLMLDGAINLHDGDGHTYVVPNAVLTFDTATLTLNAAHTAEAIDGTKIGLSGDFTYESPSSTVTGNVTAHSSSLHADIAPGTISANLPHLSASGVVTLNKPKDAAAKQPAQKQGQPGQQGQQGQSKEPPPAGQDGLTSAASLVKTLNLTMFTPVKAGSYGSLPVKITILPGTMLNTDVHVTNGAIASAKVWFSPIPQFDHLLDVDGAHIRPEGETGVLTADMGNCFTSWVANLALPSFANDYVGNAKKLPLDLTALAKTVSEQIAKLPKKSSGGGIGDVAGAIDWKASGGRADAQLTASQDRTIGPVTVQQGSDIYLTGSAAAGSGANLFFTAHADRVKAQAAGYAVDATGLSVGSIDAAKSGDPIKFKDLIITSLNLSSVKSPDGAVQKHEGGAPQVSDADVPRVAAAGIAGAGAPLPHAGAIQRAFGHHDVSGVRAQVGGTAELASRAIGAEAYATGDRIAFASAPDLRLAAHEAAHVVQQQRGVHLSGGVGHAGDPFEQHADAVADAVVRGGSAQDLLDAFPGASSGSRAVQKADAPAGSTAAPQVDLRALGINIDDPLGVKGALTPMSGTDNVRVRSWMSQHRADILVTLAMPDLIRRVRRELAPTSPTIVTTSNEDLLDLIRAGAAELQLPLPAGDAPIGYSADEVKAAASQGMSINASFTVKGADGNYHIIASGKTPELAQGSVQVVVDPGGATLNTKDHAGNTTAISVDTGLGVKFSTNLGPFAFSAGIDADTWQVGLALGPDVPQLSTLSGIFSNAQHAVSVAAKKISSGAATKPDALYESIKPHLPAIKEALSTAQAAAKPGKVSVGVKATGPGYAQHQAEGAVQGITVMATLSVTF